MRPVDADELIEHAWRDKLDSRELIVQMIENAPTIKEIQTKIPVQRVNICGIPHKVIECEDKFNYDCHFGQIDYKDCEIRINKDMTEEIKKETICHEMIHGILIHLGYNDYSQDEQLVQALGNAIYQGFDIKEMERGDKE